VALTT